MHMTNLVHVYALELYETYATKLFIKFEPRNEISNNVVCAASKASDQPARVRAV